MEDKRFAELFTDPNFQINQDSEEFRLLNPVVQKVNEKKLKAKKIVDEQDSEMDETKSDLGVNDDSDKSSVAESSSDDEHQWKKSVKEEFRKLQQEKKLKERREKHLMNKNSSSKPQVKEPKFYEIKEGASVFSNNKNPGEIIKNEKLKKLPFLNRLQHMNEANESENTLVFRSDSYGNKQMTFLSRKVNIIKNLHTLTKKWLTLINLSLNFKLRLNEIKIWKEKQKNITTSEK